MTKAEEKLAENGLSITQPRVAILNYLMEHHTHPIVDTIYNDLKPELPGMSLTTVYNTVKQFSKMGMIQMLTIDERHICVDENTCPHGHLLCEKCGKVVDVPIQGMSKKKMIDGNLIHEVHQYYKGICKDCLYSSEQDEIKQN